MSSSRARYVLLAALAAASLLGCRRDEPYHVQVDKAAQPASAPMPPQMPPVQMPPAQMPEPESAPSGDAPQMPPDHPAMPPNMSGDLEAPPVPASSLNWKLPTGWSESRSGGIRFATLKPPGDAPVEVSVVVLSGSAGGETANVNRWRGQLGLQPMDDAGIAAARKSVKAPAGQLSVYDFTGDDTKSRMVAAMLTANGSTWFVKMVGDAAAVGAARGDFDHLLSTLSFQ